MRLRYAAPILGLLLAAYGAHATAQGRMDYLTFPIADVMNDPESKAKLGEFRFVFNGGKGKKISDTNTRSTDPRPFKSDKQRCERALLNGLIKLRKFAEGQGGTGLEKIQTTSTPSGQPLKSSTEYACIAGGSNARVYISAIVTK